MSLSEKLTGKKAADFTLYDLQDVKIELSAQNGHPVVLVFFTEKCVWCRTEMPRLGEIYRHVKHDQVHVFGIHSYNGDAASTKQFAKEYNLEFPVLLDPDGIATRAYEIARVPTVIVVNGDGTIARVYEGVTEQMAGILEQTILAAAGHRELPEYSLVGNGCAPE